MPPKRTVASTSSQALPPPNLAHPCASHVPLAAASAHTHSASYHSFLTSPYFPSKPKAGARGKAAAQGLPSLVKDALDAEVVQSALLEWFDRVKQKRGMPWRKEMDMTGASKAARTQRGYEVWVSEIMLQQTQVVTVIAYYTRWMEAFPTLLSLSQASQESINAVWAGLGYYSRASRLSLGSKRVVKEFGGNMPETAKELEAIDGVGPYSAGAISSIAFGKRSAMVDGNVSRVFSRLTALHSIPTSKASTSFLWTLADVLVPKSRAGDWNQGLMELGATVCTPKNPLCEECPFSDVCLAYAEVRYRASPQAKSSPIDAIDIEDLCDLCDPYPSSIDRRKDGVTIYPMKKVAKKSREEETAVCIVEWTRDGGDGHKEVLMMKRPEKGLLAGLPEFPSIDLPPSELSTSASRLRSITSLLSTLISPSLPSLSAPPSNTPTSKLRIKQFKDLGEQKGIYSGQTRTYHILHLVLTSLDIPSLRSSSSSTPTLKLGQSLAGRGKWVGEGKVEKEGVNGIVAKIWGVRCGDILIIKSGTFKRSLPAQKGEGKEKLGTKGKGKARKKMDEYETEEEEEAEESESEESEEDKVKVEEVEKVGAYLGKKKRRIAVSSEDEE